MSYKYDKLLGKIVEVFGTQEKFAKAINIAPQTLSCKLNNKADWKREEIKKACEALHISYDELSSYFFELEIEKTRIS